MSLLNPMLHNAVASFRTMTVPQQENEVEPLQNYPNVIAVLFRGVFKHLVERSLFDEKN